MLTAAKRLASPTVARCKSTPTYVLMIIRYERSASSTDGASHLRVLRSARLVTANAATASGYTGSRTSTCATSSPTPYNMLSSTV
jgi:hypothetical protein